MSQRTMYCNKYEGSLSVKKTGQGTVHRKRFRGSTTILNLFATFAAQWTIVEWHRYVRLQFHTHRRPYTEHNSKISLCWVPEWHSCLRQENFSADNACPTLFNRRQTKTKGSISLARPIHALALSLLLTSGKRILEINPSRRQRQGTSVLVYCSNKQRSSAARWTSFEQAELESKWWSWIGVEGHGGI